MKVKKQSSKQRAAQIRQRMQSSRIVGGSSKTLVVKADYHQGHIIFGVAAGRQCTCNVLQFLVTAQDTNPTTWSKSDVNCILHRGANTYQNEIMKRKSSEIYFMINELPEYVRLRNVTYKVRIADPLAGNLVHTESFPDNGQYCLSDAILQGSVKHPCLFITIGSKTPCSTIGLLHAGEKYFFFDSHSRDDEGLRHSNGSAVVLSFSRIEEVVRHTHELATSIGLAQDMFEVTPAIVSSCLPSKPSCLPSKPSCSKNTLFDYFCDQSNKQKTFKSQDKKQTVQQKQTHSTKKGPLKTAKKKKIKTKEKEKLRKAFYRIKLSEEAKTITKGKEKGRMLTLRSRKTAVQKQEEAEKERKRKASLRKKLRMETPAGVKEREAEKERKRKASVRKRLRMESPAGVKEREKLRKKGNG